MKKSILTLIAVWVSHAAWAETVTLSGHDTTVEDIVAVADGAEIAVSKQGIERAKKGFATLLDAAKTGQKIYGFTVGVGWNKDHNYVTVDGELNKELIDASIDFNKGLIRAHVGAIGDLLDPRTVRAVMATRLNMHLTGTPGIQPEFVQTYVDMLNKDVIPVVPGKGSIGQADITVLGHVALNMIGEGEVFYQGKKMSAAEAFEAAGIKAVNPYGKDALAILSTNAYSLGVAALNVEKLRQLNKMQEIIYALSLEALNGNVSPILADNLAAKGFVYGEQSGKNIRHYLQGSYLWQLSDERAVQDPLSFRDAVWIISSLNEVSDRLADKITIQLNHSDDNPTIVVDVHSDSDLPEVQKRYLGDKPGALFSSSNFDPTPWVIDIEAATIALAHNANASAQRIIKLNHPEFTHLSRFLGTDQTYHAFGAMEKPPVALAREIQVLANPASVATMSVAGNIEDVATNAPLSAIRFGTAVDNYAYILGMELIHAAQAIDLRLQKNADLQLGKGTRALYEAFRQEVAFMEKDKSHSDDFEKAAQFIKAYSIH